MLIQHITSQKIYEVANGTKFSEKFYRLIDAKATKSQKPDAEKAQNAKNDGKSTENPTIEPTAKKTSPQEAPEATETPEDDIKPVEEKKPVKKAKKSSKAKTVKSA